MSRRPVTHKHSGILEAQHLREASRFSKEFTHTDNLCQNGLFLIRSFRLRRCDSSSDIFLCCVWASKSVCVPPKNVLCALPSHSLHLTPCLSLQSSKPAFQRVLLSLHLLLLLLLDHISRGMEPLQTRKWGCKRVDSTSRGLSSNLVSQLAILSAYFLLPSLGACLTLSLPSAPTGWHPRPRSAGSGR
jgi:hypothetical protein